MDALSHDQLMSISKVWIDTTRSLKADKKFRGMSNIQVAKAVKTKLVGVRGPGCDLEADQLFRWYSRAQANFKPIKEGSLQSGAARKVALPGEALEKGMVHHDLLQKPGCTFWK
jgi:hypothetical protein